MRQFGKVDIPQNTFLNVLKMNENFIFKKYFINNYLNIQFYNLLNRFLKYFDQKIC